MAMDEQYLKVDMESVVPHRAPMLLIDGVESFDAERKHVTVSARIRPDSPFFDGEGVPAWVAIEYMAQAAATLAGLGDSIEDPGGKPRPGLLLGTRCLTLSADRFAVGATYRISAFCTFDDSTAAAFQCEMTDDAGRVVASVSLNAYRPPDMIAFLKEHA